MTFKRNYLWHLLIWGLIILSDATSDLLRHDDLFLVALGKSSMSQTFNVFLFYSAAYINRFKQNKALLSLSILLLLSPIISFYFYAILYKTLYDIQAPAFGLVNYFYYLSNGLIFLVGGFLFGQAREVFRLQKKQAELERAAANSELQLLQSHLNPHFLFNALNTLLSLSLKNKSDLEQTIIKLSNILRYSLEHRQNPLVAAQNEINYLSDYLFVQRKRLPADYKLSEHWDQEETKIALPVFLLINLVENAFKHGDKSKNGFIEIDLRSRKNYFFFHVRNSRPPKDTNKNGNRLGLKSFEQALLAAYPNQHQFKISSKAEVFSVKFLISV